MAADAGRLEGGPASLRKEAKSGRQEGDGPAVLQDDRAAQKVHVRLVARSLTCKTSIPAAKHGQSQTGPSALHISQPPI